MYAGMQVVVAFPYVMALMVASILVNGINRIVSEPASILAGVHLFIILILSDVAVLLVIFLINTKKWKSDRFWSVRELKAAPLVLCAVLGAALNLFIVGVLALLPIPEIEQPIDILFGSNLALELLCMCLSAPVIEEIIFRGIVQKRLMKMTSLPVALILQALIFGVIHFNILQSTYAFFIGILLGFVYIWLDSVWPTIIIHAACNTTSIMLGYILGDTEIDGLYFLIMTAAAFIVMAACLIALFNKRRIVNDISDTEINNRWRY